MLRSALREARADKKAALSAVGALLAISDAFLASRSPPSRSSQADSLIQEVELPKASSVSSECAIAPEFNALCDILCRECIPLLADCACLTPGKPTLLSASAVECSLQLTMAHVCSSNHESDAIVMTAPSLMRILGVVRQWFESVAEREPYIKALRNLASLISSMLRETEALESNAALLRNISEINGVPLPSDVAAVEEAVKLGWIRVKLHLCGSVMQIIGRHWPSASAPSMQSSHCTISWKRGNRPMAALASMLLDEEEDPDSVLSALRCLCLQIGELSRTELASVLHGSHREPPVQLLPALQRCLKMGAQDEGHQGLACCALRRLMTDMGESEAFSAARSEGACNIVELLRADNEASEAAIAVLTPAASLQPTIFLPPILLILTGAADVTVRNALRVMVGASGQMSTPTRAYEMRLSLKLMCEHVIRFLGHGDVSIRQLAGHVLVNASQSDAVWLVTQICSRMSSPCPDWERLAAEEVLGSVVCGNVEEGRPPRLEALSATIDCVNSDESVTSGIDMASPWVRRLMNHMPLWARRLQRASSLPEALEEAARKAMASPGDTLPLRALVSLAGVAVAGEGLKVAELVRQEMTTQHRLTDSLLSDASHDSDVARSAQNLLFARLCPLLVLKSMPAVSLRCEGSDVLLRLVAERVFAAAEFEGVSKVAAEVLGRLPAEEVVPLLLDCIENFYRNQNASADWMSALGESIAPAASLATRSTVALCHAVSVQGARLGPYLDRICGLLLLAFGRQDSALPLQMTQRACIELLGSGIQASVALGLVAPPKSTNDAPPPKIVDVDALEDKVNQQVWRPSPLVDESGNPTLACMLRLALDVGLYNRLSSVLLHALPGLEDSGDVLTTAGRMCMLNGVIVAANALSPDALHSLAKEGGLLGLLVSTVGTKDNLPGSIRAACLQSLFVIIFRAPSLVAQDSVGTLWDAVTEGLHAQEEDVQLAALKAVLGLLAAVGGGDTGADAQLSSKIFSLRKQLVILSTVEGSSSAVTELATKALLTIQKC